MPLDPSQILHVKNAALLMNTSEKAVYQHVARRTIPFRRLGSRIVFVRTELEQFLAALDGCRVDEALGNIAERNAVRGK